MSFFSAINEMGLDQILLMKIGIQDVFRKIMSVFNQFFDAVVDIAHRLSSMEKMEVKENWEYVIDPATNIAILKVTKDPMAIKRTRNALRELFR